nr:MAG TPA: hypothetical protein [Caudoviricetes sp.]
MLSNSFLFITSLFLSIIHTLFNSFKFTISHFIIKFN